ncbi:antitoxin [Derxia gummosa]|uniref:Antitoxin n=1 Tax=Derxia gummosa DSM 723 TaxID=1121388 RepID=A0A8B6X5E5_9BURK|nr:AbrB/MazE/SpoVT family DNA-binding domain-containing protein [Derxia gummosa]
METAKLFWSGRSQAVRLPKEFRIEGSEVRIRRHGAAVILEPIANDWGWLDALGGPLDAAVVQAATEQPAAEERPGLDQLFGD